MFARVSRFHENIEDIDTSTRLVREKIVPQVETLPGFVGMQALVNRATGDTLGITYWETEEAMRDSETEADRVREESANLTDAQIREVERYEVVLRVGL